MTFIKRNWTPQSADDWRKEDWIAVILSALSYFTLAIGSALSLLLLTVGFVILGIAIILIILMYWVIDPKLRTISEEYEKKQKEYLHHLEGIQKWETTR